MQGCKQNNKYTVVDLFSGVGGFSYGFFYNEAFEISLANELDKETAQAYEINHPMVKVLNCDIKKITEEEIKKNICLPVDIVVGGPPCQSYSTLGKRRKDETANLFYEYCRLIKILNPKIFIFENVVGILSMDNGELFKTIKLEFSKLGYNLKHKILNAVDYGVPQLRQRVILVGTKKENSFEYPQPTHGENDLTTQGKLKPFVTLEDALSDMPFLKSGEKSVIYSKCPNNEFQKFVRNGCSIVSDNESPKNGERLIEIMQALPDGGDKSHLPEKIRPKSGYGNTYAKLWWKKPVPTITRNFACVSSSRCIHPRDSRALTTREGARLQSFPDSFVFFGSRAKKNLQIGNAVPPLLSIALAKQVKKYLENKK